MRESRIPYGRHEVDEDDIRAVVEVLRGDWLTTGPAVESFESAFEEFTGAAHAVAVANGTAALHLTMLAAGIGPGDEVIVPALTFAASANCARYVGATVVFADIRPDTLTVDVDHVASLITPRTRAIVTVDYAGLPSDLVALQILARRHGLLLVDDGCHALGATQDGRSVGAIADCTTFSFHPVKHITTGEGGMITTNDAATASRMRILRNHGITTDPRRRDALGTFEYDMVALGYNYRLSDIQCALGRSQLAKLPRWLERRQAMATRYRDAFDEIPTIALQHVPSDRTHAYHLFPIRVTGDAPAATRLALFRGLRMRGIAANVHYRPVYRHRYWRELGYPAGLCPVAEHAYDSLLSLPMWHGLEHVQQERVIDAVIAECVVHA
jgi:perosamine synthetase